MKNRVRKIVLGYNRSVFSMKGEFMATFSRVDSRTFSPPQLTAARPDLIDRMADGWVRRNEYLVSRSSSDTPVPPTPQVMVVDQGVCGRVSRVLGGVAFRQVFPAEVGSGWECCRSIDVCTTDVNSICCPQNGCGALAGSVHKILAQIVCGPLNCCCLCRLKLGSRVRYESGTEM